MIIGIMIASAVFAGPPVTCGSDADCAAKNPGVSTYGTPNEDQPGWICATMGNHTCGPTGDVNGVRGIYPVPGGERIVWTDHSQFVPMPDSWVSVYQGKPGEDPTVIEPQSWD